jgi:multicomponent Na+:H+ antiporter subunit D
VLAILLGRWGHRPRVPVGDVVGAAVGATRSRRATVALARVLERTDQMLRRWPVAGLSLLALAIAFGAAMGLGR